MPFVDYTFRCRRGRPDPEWTRVLSQESDSAAVTEARLLLHSQAALAPQGPIAIEVARGRGGNGQLRWLGSWAWEDGEPRWESA
jgi:hypothetical protein